jgi:hypothetical protein
MEQLTINAPEAGALNKSAETFLVVAQSITIDSPEMYQTAASELMQIKRKANDLEAQRVDLVTPLNATVKKINDLFRAPMALLARAEQTIKDAMIAYDQQQERQAAEERRKAEEAAARERARLQEQAAAADARRQAEETRLRDEAAAAERAAQHARDEAERIRAAAEEAARAGDKTRAAELEALARDQTREAQAADITAARAESKAESKAEEFRADELRGQAASVQALPVVAVSAAPKVAGIAGKSKWKGEVTSKLKLIQFVAANPQFIALLDANESAINKMASALKSAMVVDGVRVYEERQIAARAA